MNHEYINIDMYIYIYIICLFILCMSALSDSSQDVAKNDQYCTQDVQYNNRQDSCEILCASNS